MQRSAGDARRSGFVVLGLVAALGAIGLIEMPPKAETVEAKSVEAKYEGDRTITFRGSLEPNEDGKGFVWKVPGTVRLQGTLPWDKDTPRKVRVALIARIEERSVTLGSAIAQPAVKDGQLEFDAELTMIAAWTTAGPTNVVITPTNANEPIASLPTEITFSE
jgi:hypothetical protein